MDRVNFYLFNNIVNILFSQVSPITYNGITIFFIQQAVELSELPELPELPAGQGFMAG
jgi:hypothetical protein